MFSLTFKYILLSFREKRQRLDPKDYTIGDLTGETAAKLPGEINGQQFIIQNNKVRRSSLLKIRMSYCKFISKKMACMRVKQRVSVF